MYSRLEQPCPTICLTIFALSRFEEQGLVPLFRVYGFEVDEFVKFKNRPFIGRFGVKFCKLDLSPIGARGLLKGACTSF